MRWVQKSGVKLFRMGFSTGGSSRKVEFFDRRIQSKKSSFSTGSASRNCQSKKVESTKPFFELCKKDRSGFSRKRPFLTDKSDCIRNGLKSQFVKKQNRGTKLINPKGKNKNKQNKNNQQGEKKKKRPPSVEIRPAHAVGVGRPRYPDGLHNSRTPKLLCHLLAPPQTPYTPTSRAPAPENANVTHEENSHKHRTYYIAISLYTWHILRGR